MAEMTSCAEKFPGFSREHKDWTFLRFDFDFEDIRKKSMFELEVPL